MRKSLALIESKEKVCVDILLPCIAEIVDKANYKKVCGKELRELLRNRLRDMSEDSGFNEIQRCEIQRIFDFSA